MVLVRIFNRNFAALAARRISIHLSQAGVCQSTRNFFTSRPISHVRRFSTELKAERKSDILRHLSVIIDPDLNRDIVSLGFVKNLEISSSDSVTFDLELTTPACPVKEQFVAACESVLKSNLPWVTSVTVNLTAQKKIPSASVSTGLKNVQAIVAVSSCKGGVGKSSVAVNLAYMLSEVYKLKVGLLDADIYGPSLPSLVPTKEKAEVDPTMKEQIQPFKHGNVKLMSLGFLRPGESAALRGPMASGMIQQLLTMTGWGDLDFLIIDMPPGTGDIQLTVAQHAKIDGAVVVTTPQLLSVVDVEKGIELYNKMEISNLAMVENFAYFNCGNCNVKHEIFGNSNSVERIAEKFGIDHIIKLPIETKLAKQSNIFPYISDPENFDSEPFAAFKTLADSVIRGVSKVKYDSTNFQLNVNPDNSLTAIETRQNARVAFQKRPSESEVDEPKEVAWKCENFSARELRLACKSATMIDEWTGEKMFDEKKIPSDVKPTKIEAAGRYAVRVDWSDGHHSIFPIKAIKKLCAEIEMH